MAIPQALPHLSTWVLNPELFLQFAVVRESSPHVAGERHEGAVLPTQCVVQCRAERASPAGLGGSIARTERSLLSVQVYVSVDTTASRPGEQVSAWVLQLLALQEA